MVTGVNTAEECCLGSGLSFRNDSGVCRQCIGEQLLFVVPMHKEIGCFHTVVTLDAD